MLKRLVYITVSLAIMAGFLLLFSPTSFAESNITYECTDGTTIDVGVSSAMNGDPCGSHGGTSNNPSGAGAQSQNIQDSGEVSTGKDNDELDKLLNNGINILTALVGLVIVISMVVAGIQYQTAGDNASQVSAAKNRITMAVLSLLLFFFTYAVLQWLIPGGIW